MNHNNYRNFLLEQDDIENQEAINTLDKDEFFILDEEVDKIVDFAKEKTREKVKAIRQAGYIELYFCSSLDTVEIYNFRDLWMTHQNLTHSFEQELREFILNTFGTREYNR